MRRKLLISMGMALAAAGMLFAPGDIGHATPTAPVIVVNETIKQCDIVILGDECRMCTPPAGWTILDRTDPAYQTMSCPAGFTKVNLQLDCKAVRNPYCCGGWSNWGECTDLVINETQQACAFLPNTSVCGLPPGWSRRPANVPEHDWMCNFAKQTWVSDLACTVVTPALTPVVAPVPTEGAARAPQAALPIGGLALIGLGVAALAWLKRR